jgi:serine/threonine protein kinase
MAKRGSKGTLRGLPSPSAALDLRETIGEGAYGQVRKAVLKDVKQLVAVKIIPIIPEEKEEIALELEVLRKFSSHRNIARFYGGFYNGVPETDKDGALRNHLWLVMQYCAYGSAQRLMQHCRKPRPLPDGT